MLIVGAGPTGLTLACELARRGVSFRLIEAAPGPQPGSRGKGIQPRTLEVFDDLGIVDGVIARGRMAMPIRSTAPDGQVTLGGTYTLRDRPDIPYPASLITPEWRIEEALRLRLAERLCGRVRHCAQQLRAVGRERVGGGSQGQGGRGSRDVHRALAGRLRRRDIPTRRDASTIQLSITYRGSVLARDGRDENALLRAGDRAPDATELTTMEGERRLFDLTRGGRFTLLNFGAKTAIEVSSFDGRTLHVVGQPTGPDDIGCIGLSRRDGHGVNNSRKTLDSYRRRRGDCRPEPTEFWERRFR